MIQVELFASHYLDDKTKKKPDDRRLRQDYPNPYPLIIGKAKDLFKYFRYEGRDSMMSVLFCLLQV